MRRELLLQGNPIGELTNCLVVYSTREAVLQACVSMASEDLRGTGPKRRLSVATTRIYTRASQDIIYRSWPNSENIYWAFDLDMERCTNKEGPELSWRDRIE